MKTKLLKGTNEDLDTAASIIRAGGLVAFPTETVYGLGADALNAEAVEKIYIAKGRPNDNPTIVTIAEQEDVYSLCPRVTEDMKKLMDAFWPGPMTMIVPAADIIPPVTTAGLPTAGMRMPDSDLTRELIRRSRPLAGPSANLSGKPSPTTAQHVMDDMDGRIDAVLDGGPCRVGIESTIIDMSSEEPMILRPGMITKAQFEEVLGRRVLLDSTLNVRPDPARGDFKPKAPGQKYKHYAPNAPMILFQGEHDRVMAAIEEEKKKHEQAGEKVCVIAFSENQSELAAHEIYARLREADKENVDIILATALPEQGEGFSVMNRMLKSAGFNIKEV